jgi:hypothetical protein
MAQILPFVRKNPAHKATEQQPQAPQPLESQAAEPPPEAQKPISLAEFEKLLDYFLLLNDLEKRCGSETRIGTLCGVAVRSAAWIIRELEAELKTRRPV